MKSKQVQEFKETEIGKIPSDWQLKKLIELAQTKSDVVAGPFGSNLVVDDYRSQGIPIIRLQNIERYRFIKKDIKFIDKVKYDELKYHSFKAGDVVLAKLGDPIGKACILPDDLVRGIVTADVVRIRIPDNVMDNYFLLFAINSDNIKNQLYSRQLGTTRPRVNLSDVRELLLPIPPLIIQQKIGKTFFDLNTKIENLQHQNKVLEQIAQTIFKSWFVDFDEVTKFEDSKLGKIPKGWKVESLEDICDIFSGGTPATTNSDYWNGGIFWLSSGETRNSFIIDTERKITQLGIENSSTRLAKKLDVLIASAGQGNTRGQTSLCLIDSYINQSIVALRSKKEFLYSYYLYFNIKSRYDELRGLSDSHSSRGSLPKNILVTIGVIIPEEIVLKKFNITIDPILKKIEKNLFNIEILILIRDSLLPKLMSGEIRV